MPNYAKVQLMSNATDLPAIRQTTPGWSVIDSRIVAAEWEEAFAIPVVEPRVQQYLRARVIIERIVAFGLLVATIPLLLVLGLAVGLTSRGPILYSQWRLGRFGKPFRIYKLRTMAHRCETHTGPVWAVADDPRTTPIGRWLRDSHLDELPQLWNVLCGDMSLIGPRPERPEIASQVQQALPEFRYRLLVRPGITGLAQIRLPADTDIDTVRRKLAHDLYYIRNLSPLMDIRVALSTPQRLIGDMARSMLRRIGRPASITDVDAHAAIAAADSGIELRIAA